MPNDPRSELQATANDPPQPRRRYEAPRLERKRSVARVTLASHGGGQTTTTVAFSSRHHP